MREIVRNRILKKYNYHCVYCGATEKLEVDHIIPLCRNGRHDENNMQILCKKCNIKKGRGVDISPYVKMGESPNYICLRRDFPIQSFSPTEFSQTIEHLFAQNNEMFDIF